MNKISSNGFWLKADRAKFCGIGMQICYVLILWHNHVFRMFLNGSIEKADIDEVAMFKEVL